MQPGSSRRERILAYGRSGSGKSSTWMAVAQWIADTGSTAKIYVGDTDNAWDAMGYDEISHIVIPTHITNYREGLEWARKTRDQVDPRDWVVFDMVDKAWPWAQEHYFTTKMGNDDLMLGDIYLDNQRSIEDKTVGMAGDHGSNWGVIYKYYHGLINTVLNMPCHVLAVAASKEIRTDTKAAIVAQYKDVGFYPSGPPNENELAHVFHSVLYCAETPRDWLYTSIKEMGPINRPKRKMLKGEKVSDFVVTYLFNVAGWRP